MLSQHQYHGEEFFVKDFRVVKDLDVRKGVPISVDEANEGPKLHPEIWWTSYAGRGGGSGRGCLVVLGSSVDMYGSGLDTRPASSSHITRPYRSTGDASDATRSWVWSRRIPFKHRNMCESFVSKNAKSEEAGSEEKSNRANNVDVMLACRP
ncbi:hypothetical protein C8R44DRAFT_731153 [Mycena epipterygia]|nr:hypothetical protein C8R44DRAFT_731153 [Mycena epipterygia]